MLSGEFDEFVTRFQVPQYGVIYSKWLRVPELLTFIAMFVGFVLDHMCWRLGIFEKMALEATPLVSALKPGRGFIEQLDPAVNEFMDYAPDASSLPFCKQSGSALGRRPCKDFPLNLMVPPLRHDGGINIASTIGEFTFVPGAPDRKGHVYSSSMSDQLVLRLQLGHTECQDFHFWHAQGFMKFKGEEGLRVIPGVGGTDEQAFPLTGAEAVRGETKSLPHTGSDFLKEGMCVNTKYGALFSLSTFLRAANVTLDGKGDLRLHGFAFKVVIRFTNMDPGDFWRWPNRLQE